MISQRQSTICELLFPTAILAVRMNRKRLVVVLELEIYIYDISTMKLLHTLDTGPNSAGKWRRIYLSDAETQANDGLRTAICALSPSNDASYLAYPAPVPAASSPLSNQPPAPSQSSSTGSILIFDTISLTAVNMIQAHKSPIAAMAISSQGTMLATASDKGTVIRVFSVPDAKKLGEYRRGSKSARVFSMNFNAVGSLLAVSSDTETVHVYNLLETSKSGNGGGGNRGDLTRTESHGGVKPHSPPVSEAPSSPTLSATSPNGNGSRPGESAHTAGASFSRRSFHLGKNLVAGMGGYLPNRVTEVWEPRRDFAFCKLRGGAGGRSVVAMSP